MSASPSRPWVKDLLFLATCGAGLLGLVLAFVVPGGSWAASPDTHEGIGEAREQLREVAAAIDARSKLDEPGRVSPRASNLLLARRLSLALTGTVPSIEELHTLESLPEQEALAWWVDSRLNDRRYADYMAERLARALVGTEQGDLILYRRRRFVAWLSDQLATGQAWDEVTRAMLSGTGLWTQHPATNFITAAIQAETAHPDPERLAARTSRVFLAQRLDCAQCHDHPFNPAWTQADFQGMAAFFAHSEVTLQGLSNTSGQHEYSDPSTQQQVQADPKVPYGPELLPASGDERERFAAWLTHPDNPAFARATVNRIWALLLGRALVEPIDDIPLDIPLPPALELLAQDFVAHGYDLSRLIRIIAMTEAFARSSSGPPSPESKPEPFARFPLTRLRPEQVVGALLQACSIETLDHESHALSRLLRSVQTRDFIERYGDAGIDELEAEGGTIPQRLLSLNGELLHERSKDNLVANAATRIATLAPTDTRAVELAYLAILTRRPSPSEASYFEAKLAGLRGGPRNEALSDLYWVLLNSTEAAWNH